MAVVGLTLLLPAAVQSEIYKYKDREGRIYLTDKPMKGKSFTLLKRFNFGSSRSAATPAGSLAAMNKRREKLTPLIEQVAAESSLNPELLHAVIRAESAYNARAVSRKGAVGLMQLMPETARQYGVNDRYDPMENLAGGARYLQDLLARYDNNLELSLAAYNAGETAVAKYGNQVPPYPETVNYVEKVMRFYATDAGRVTSF